jgi:hypothetical protein
LRFPEEGVHSSLREIEEAHMRRHVFPFLVSVLFFAGCASVSQNTQRWVGHDVRELVQSWGAPTEVRDDTGGGRIVIYDLHSRVALAGGNPDTSQSGSSEMVDRRRIRVFFVNREGTITSSASEGR